MDYYNQEDPNDRAKLQEVVRAVAYYWRLYPIPELPEDFINTFLSVATNVGDWDWPLITALINQETGLVLSIEFVRTFYWVTENQQAARSVSSIIDATNQLIVTDSIFGDALGFAAATRMAGPFFEGVLFSFFTGLFRGSEPFIHHDIREACTRLSRESLEQFTNPAQPPQVQVREVNNYNTSIPEIPQLPQIPQQQQQEETEQRNEEEEEGESQEDPNDPDYRN